MTIAAPVRGSLTMPSWSGAAHTRNLASLLLNRAYRLRSHGAFHVGTTGPVLLVVASDAALAGVVVQAVSPRPVHVMASPAAMAALPAGLLRATGAIAVEGPTAVSAQQAARAALEDGRAVAVCGSEAPVAYLAAVSGAPVVPVVILGVDGRVPTDPPRPRSEIDVYVSAPVHVDVPGDPLRSATRLAVAEQVRQIVADAMDRAGRRSGRTKVER